MGESILEARLRHQGLGPTEPFALQQPGGVAVVLLPRHGGAFQVVRLLEVVPLGSEPAGEVCPLAQQAFQGDLDEDFAVAFALDQEPRGHECVDFQARVGRKVGPPGDAAHGLVIVGIDGGQPRNESPVQSVELGLPDRGIPGEDRVDLRLNHVVHAAHRLVSVHRQLAVLP